MDQCLNSVLNGTSDSCYAVTEEECQYYGKLIRDFNAEDENQCQEICQLTRLPDCGYWSFNRTDNTCSSWEFPTRKCIALGGPKEPSFVKCIGKQNSHVQNTSIKEIPFVAINYYISHLFIIFKTVTTNLIVPALPDVMRAIARVHI